MTRLIVLCIPNFVVIVPRSQPFRPIAKLCHKQGMSGPPLIFDRRAVARNRNRSTGLAETDLSLIRESRAQLLDRLRDVTRSFSQALALGGRDGTLAKALSDNHAVSSCVSTDLTFQHANASAFKEVQSVNVDEEWIPFRNESFDLIIAELCLHWANDLPGSLIQLRRTLQPDGLFLGTVFGGQTLHELRSAWTEAESACLGGVSPRVSPFLDIRDAGDLLVRAGFGLPVTDSDIFQLEFESVTALARALRHMGETNAVRDRMRGLTGRHLWETLEDTYKSHYSTKSGKIIATFEIITLTGWAPDPGQQKPLAPGSATARLATALGGEETPV